jgi:hypothetical protein
MMTSEDLKELASVFRVESANVGGPVQASLQRIATALDEKATACEPCITFYEPAGYSEPGEIPAGVFFEPKPDADVKLPTETDELESLDQ